MQRWYENEDCDVMLTRADLVCTTAGEYETTVNLQGPGGATRYYFFARVAAGVDNPIRELILPGDTPFEAKVEPVEVTGTPTGFQWLRLGSVVRRRKYHPLTIRGEEGLPGLHSLWVSQVPGYLLAGRAEQQLARADHPEPLSGVPLGGVGAGKLELCPDGRFRNFTINGNIDTPFYNSEGSFLALHFETEQGHAGCVLSTESLQDLPPVANLEFEGCYPQAHLLARDRRFPVEAELHASGPIIPRNLNDSCLPLALFMVRLVNTKDMPVTVTVAFSMENFLGCGGTPVAGEERREKGYYEYWEEREGNREEPWTAPGCSGVLMIGEPKQEKRGQGRYLLATNAAGAGTVCGWRVDEGAERWRQFADEGVLPEAAGSPSEGEATAGVVYRTIALAPRQSTEVRFVFAWWVPHFWQIVESDYGHYYTNLFDSVEEVALYGLREFDRLWQEAGEVPTLLAQSTLPAWLARSLANDAYVFSTCTWLTRDGRFSVNESPKNMFGCMGTLDQKLYGSHYYSLFFPECDISELLQFARAQADDGGIQHDLGYGQLDQKGHASTWPDLSSSLTIQALKLYQLTGDQEFLDEIYPHCVRGLLEWQAGRDTDGDGIANISGVGNTFDAEKYEGTSAYIATLWLAALRSLEELARHQGDTPTQQCCQELFEKARHSAIEELWNGSYFANYYDVQRNLRNDNCHFSQLAGEFYSLLLGLGLSYGESYVISAQRHILRLNYPPDLVFPTNEATPEGKMAYRDLWGWLPHSRVLMGGLSFFLDLADEGLQVMERMEEVVAQLNHNNCWDQRLFFEPDTGRQHWGTFYMTAPATWYTYQALLGVLWDKPKGVLGLCPHLPESLRPFSGPVFLPDLWAWLTVSVDGRQMGYHPFKRFAESLPLERLRLPEVGGEPRVVVDGTLVPVTRTGSDYGYGEYACSMDLAQIEELEITWPS